MEILISEKNPESRCSFQYGGWTKKMNKNNQYRKKNYNRNKNLAESCFQYAIPFPPHLASVPKLFVHFAYFSLSSRTTSIVDKLAFLAPCWLLVSFSILTRKRIKKREKKIHNGEPKKKRFKFLHSIK